MDGPLRFTPHVRPMVWGGRRLASMLHKPLPAAGPHGESWEVSDHPLHRSVVAAGPWTGSSLRDLMEQHPSALLGPAAARHTTFPWLVKFLDAADWLSVQVHPDEQAVRTLWPGEGSKTEVWFVLDAAPGSRIYAGLLPGVDEAQLRARAVDGTVAECLHSFEPHPGDCVFLPAGTVHAVGGGVLIAEVQQTSDATFRLFDWNRRDSQGRSRQLHLEEALASIDWSAGPVYPVRVPDFRLHNGQPASARPRQPLVACPYFRLEFLQEVEPFDCGGSESLQLLIVLQGRGVLSSPTGEHELYPGQVWVLPAALTRCCCRPAQGLSALVCTLPAGPARGA